MSITGGALLIAELLVVATKALETISKLNEVIVSNGGSDLTPDQLEPFIQLRKEASVAFDLAMDDFLKRHKE